MLIKDKSVSPPPSKEKNIRNDDEHHKDRNRKGDKDRRRSSSRDRHRHRRRRSKSRSRSRSLGRSDRENTEYLRPEVGKVYSGTVTSLRHKVFFVRLKGFVNNVEGMVHISNLCSYRVKDVKDVVSATCNE